MSTSITAAGPRTYPGSPTAKASTAAAVVALATAVAGSALVAGIATGSAIDSMTGPDPAVVHVTTQVADTTPVITTDSTHSQRGEVTHSSRVS
jgi:hypothetical protein